MGSRYQRYDAEKTREQYDEFYQGGDFRQFPRAEQAFVKALVRRFGFEAGSKALDVGCGTGKYASYLAAAGLEATGVDLSAQAIKVAAQRFPNCTFQVADAEQLPFDDGAFDVVFSSGLSLLNEPDLSALEPLMRHMVAKARPGGHVVIVKTTGLTGRQSKKNTRMDHTLDGMRWLLEVPGCEVIHVSATYPQAFQVLGRGGFGAPITGVSRLVSRVSGIPVRACVVARRTSEGSSGEAGSAQSSND